MAEFNKTFEPMEVVMLRYWHVQYCQGALDVPFSAKTIQHHYECAESTVYEMLRGDTYQDIGGPYKTKNMLKKINEDDIKEIRERHREGESQVKLAQEYNMNSTYISNLVRGEQRPDVGGPIKQTSWTDDKEK